MASSKFIDPSSLSFSTKSFVPASPAPSSSFTHDDDEHDDIDPTHASGPARKRARKDEGALSVSEQRKEARAHRNRIAAQNSRDRRKAQFSFLERRVSELEDENRRLRSGVIAPAAVAPPVFVANSLPPPLSSAVEDHLRAEREKARERENEELKERIKTLERGWDAVVKALAAQGVAAGLFGTTQPSQPPTMTTPATQPTPMKLDVPTQPTFTAFPSPAPSHSSLDFDIPSSTTTTTSSPISDFLPMVSTGGDHRGTFIGSLDVPAAGGIIGCGASAAGNTNTLSFAASAPVYQGAAVEGPAHADDDNDTAMEALFREILASPRASHSVVPVQGAVSATQVSAGGADACVERVEEVIEGQVEENTDADESTVAEWANEIEMQRMLDSMIMDIQGENGEMGLLGMGIGNEGSTDLGLGIDMGLVAYDAGVDFSRTAWEVNSTGIF